MDLSLMAKTWFQMHMSISSSEASRPNHNTPAILAR